jgi:hypothetical protein
MVHLGVCRGMRAWVRLRVSSGRLAFWFGGSRLVGSRGLALVAGKKLVRYSITFFLVKKRAGRPFFFRIVWGIIVARQNIPLLGRN